MLEPFSPAVQSFLPVHTVHISSSKFHETSGELRPAQASSGQLRPAEASSGQLRLAQVSSGQLRRAQASSDKLAQPALLTFNNLRSSGIMNISPTFQQIHSICISSDVIAQKLIDWLNVN